MDEIAARLEGFLHERLAARGALAAEAATAGLVLVRQRPGSAKGVIFMTLEDETGTVNVVVWPNVLERFRQAVLGGRLVLVQGRVQRADEIVHLVAASLEVLTHWLDLLTPEGGARRPSPDPAAAGAAGGKRLTACGGSSSPASARRRGTFTARRSTTFSPAAERPRGRLRPASACRRYAVSSKSSRPMSMRRISLVPAPIS